MSSLQAHFPKEIRLQISQYLTAQDLQAASSSCKLLYQLFADQGIWEKAYTSLFNGYPSNNFVVTQLVREVKRLDFIAFDQPWKANWLEDWCTSWKQRTIFVLHVLKVQSDVVSAVRQRTDIFEQPRDTPLYDAKFIAALERHLGAALPIDFAVFLQNFAHQITFATGDEEHEQWPLLASGKSFEDRWNWQEAIDGIYFAEYDQTDSWGSDDRDRLLTASSRAYLNEMTIACFTLLYSVDDGEGKYYLSLILDADQSLENEIQPEVKGKALCIDFQSMKNGVGKVVYNGFYPGTPYNLYAIAESFTDYLVQWGSVVIVLGRIPLVDENGYVDLTTRLPKHPKSLSSILLPQYKDWGVGNYAPIYFSTAATTFESSEGITSLKQDGIREVLWDSKWPDVPNSMMNGCTKRYWKPYYLPIALESQMLTSLQELQRDQVPKTDNRLYPLRYQFNIRFYNTLQGMIDEWAELTPYIPDVATLSSPKDLERVREQTLHITNLFHKLKTRLPVALYHQNIVKAHCWLYYYKCFLEHLQALALNGYKYNMEELSDFEAQVRKELNLMRDTIIVKCQRAQGYPRVNLDAIAELNIDWSIV